MQYRPPFETNSTFSIAGDRECQCGHGKRSHQMGFGECRGSTAICKCEQFRPAEFDTRDC